MKKNERTQEELVKSLQKRTQEVLQMQRDLTEALQEVDSLAQALSDQSFETPSMLSLPDVQKTDGDDRQIDSRTKETLVSMLEEAWDAHESHAALGSARIPEDVL